MNTKIMENMKAKLNEVQSKSTANTIGELDLIDICEKAEAKAQELLKLSDKFQLEFEYWYGEKRRGWNYTSTGMTFKFNKNGNIRAYEIWRGKHSYSVNRLTLLNPQDFTELELKLLRKYAGVNNHNNIDLAV